MFNATLGGEWKVQPVYGVSSLATSGHLPPAPLNQTNTKPEMPESDNTNYTLQIPCSLPDVWEAAQPYPLRHYKYMRVGRFFSSF